MDNNEVLEFAKEIGATDLHDTFSNTKYRALFKRSNYFLLEDGTWLIVKVSRNKKNPFFGLGKKFIETFNQLTEKDEKNYYYVGLLSKNSGWVLSKQQIMNLLSKGSLSYSERGKEYKINTRHFKDTDLFTSIAYSGDGDHLFRSVATTVGV